MSAENRSLALIAVLCALLGAVLFTGALRLVETARGDVPAVPAVGPAGAALFDAGVSPAAAPDPAPAAASTAPAPLPDPTTDPGGYARDVQGAFRGGAWFLLVVLGLFGVARTLLWVATRWSIAWLRRYTPVLVTASGLLAAVGATLGAGGSFDWQASLGALAGALALYLRVEPAPKPAAEPAP